MPSWFVVTPGVDGLIKCGNLIPYPDLILFKAWPREVWVQNYLDPKLTRAIKARALEQEMYNNYSMSPRWIWSDKITNECVARVGYNHFISNKVKGEWNNCFSKFSNRVLQPIFISTIYKAKNFKPWPNEDASRRKLKTWVYLRLRLARPCMDLRWLAIACAHFGRDQICTQVDASFPPFGHSTQVNARWVTSINLLLANEIRDMPALEWVFCDLRVLVRKLASPFGHPTQVST